MTDHDAPPAPRTGAETGAGSAARFTGPVAYLTGEYPRVSHTFIQREAEALRAEGIEVVTCSIRRTGPEHQTGPEEVRAAETTFYVLAAAKNPVTLARAHLKALIGAPGKWFAALRLAISTSPPGLTAFMYQIFYFLEAAVLAERLKADGVRHIHNHFANSSCSVAMLTSVMSGIPFSVMMHGPAVFFEAEKWRLDEKIHRAAFVACISHFCRSQGMIWARPDAWEKMRIVHCGVDPSLYEAADPARGETGKRLIFVGRLAAVKGAPVLLDAFARLRADHPEATLTMVGDGEDRAWIEARIAALGLGDAVEITGYQSQGEVAAHLARADVFVLPSFAEGLPVVLMEAMASRLPVVTTRIAGIPELVRHGENGFIAPPGDAETLADHIATLLADPDLRRRMGEAGRAAVVAEHDIAREAAWLATLIRRSAAPGDAAPLGLRP